VGLRSHDATQDCDAGHNPDRKCEHGDSNERDYEEPSQYLDGSSLPNTPTRSCLLLTQDDVVSDDELDPTGAVSDVSDPEDPERGFVLVLGLGPALLDISSWVGGKETAHMQAGVHRPEAI
jgi:hypothetical protein